MFKKKINIYSLIITIAAFGLTICFYNKLPEQIPIHWNWAGEVDNYANKSLGAFFAPIAMVLIWMGMLILPKIDPKKENYNKFQSSYEIVIGVIVTFLFGLQMALILISLGYNISMNKIIMLMMGIMFMIIGNYLPKAKSNFFYGIKTPWTLSSEVSWRKTHRLGGKLFVLSGIVTIISTAILQGKYQTILMTTTLMAIVIILIVASYFYSKEK